MVRYLGCPKNVGAGLAVTENPECKHERKVLWYTTNHYFCDECQEEFEE